MSLISYPVIRLSAGVDYLLLQSASDLAHRAASPKSAMDRCEAQCNIRRLLLVRQQINSDFGGGGRIWTQAACGADRDSL